MQIQESGQMYLETIYVLLKEKGHVRSIDICEHMGYSKPSISRAMGLLKEGGYIEMQKDGAISLTPSGEEIAKNIYNRHTLLTRLLTRLGVSEKTAAEDACKLEHVISQETFLAIQKHVEEYGK